MKNKKNKGQALVEFVIILPIFVFMLFATIDFGKIFYIKNNLESRMEDVITFYQKEKTIEEIENNLDLKKEYITLDIKQEKEYLEFTLEKETSIITPGLNLLLGKNYKASTKRVIYNE